MSSGPQRATIVFIKVPPLAANDGLYSFGLIFICFFLISTTYWLDVLRIFARDHEYVETMDFGDPLTFFFNATTRLTFVGLE